MNAYAVRKSITRSTPTEIRIGLATALQSRTVQPIDALALHAEHP